MKEFLEYETLVKKGLEHLLFFNGTKLGNLGPGNRIIEFKLGIELPSFSIERDFLGTIGPSENDSEWNSPTFYGASFLTKNHYSDLDENTLTYLNNNEISYMKMSVYNAYEKLLNIALTPVILTGKYGNIHLQNNISGKVVINFPFPHLNQRSKINEEIRKILNKGISVEELEISEEKFKSLFEKYL